MVKTFQFLQKAMGVVKGSFQRPNTFVNRKVIRYNLRILTREYFQPKVGTKKNIYLASAEKSIFSVKK